MREKEEIEYYNINGELQKDGCIANTDDLKHDACAVAAFEKVVIDHVRDKGLDIKKIHQWTDGCAGQYPWGVMVLLRSARQTLNMAAH